MADLLSQRDIEAFIVNGLIRIDNAFSLEIAEQVVETLWNDLPVERSNPGSWTEPVIRLGMYTQQPFVDSVNTAKLHAAFDRKRRPYRHL